MKISKFILTSSLLLSFTVYAQDSDYTPFFGNINGHRISSYEPCVHREKRGGWYDHCFFSLDGTNSFGDEVSPEAKSCAHKSNKRLYDWLSEKGSEVEKAYSILEKVHGKKSIYIIVTDTMGTTIPGQSRESAKLWTWSGSDDGSRGRGHYFKFNIGISKTGKCSIPTEEDMLTTIRSWVGAERYAEEEANILSEATETVAVSIDDTPREYLWDKLFGTKEERKAKREVRKERRKARREARRALSN